MVFHSKALYNWYVYSPSIDHPIFLNTRWKAAADLLYGETLMSYILISCRNSTGGKIQEEKRLCFGPELHIIKPVDKWTVPLHMFVPVKLKLYLLICPLLTINQSINLYLFIYLFIYLFTHGKSHQVNS